MEVALIRMEEYEVKQEPESKEIQMVEKQHMKKQDNENGAERVN